MTCTTTIRAQKPKNIQTNTPLLSPLAPPAANALEAKQIDINTAVNTVVIFIISSLLMYQLTLNCKEIIVIG
jgi:hypothetical protein